MVGDTQVNISCCPELNQTRFSSLLGFISRRDSPLKEILLVRKQGEKVQQRCIYAYRCTQVRGSRCYGSHEIKLHSLIHLFMVLVVTGAPITRLCPAVVHPFTSTLLKDGITLD